MSLELRRCPFCGGEAEVREVSEGEQVYYVECTECNIRTPLNFDMEVPKAKWNARVIGRPEIMETVRQAFFDLIDDSAEGKYKDFCQSAPIQECYEKVVIAIKDACIPVREEGEE